MSVLSVCTTCMQTTVAETKLAEHVARMATAAAGCVDHHVALVCLITIGKSVLFCFVGRWA